MSTRAHSKPGMSCGPGRQTGAALIMVAVGLIAILAVAGLALDGGHVMLNKSRLQNAVDAAAIVTEMQSEAGAAAAATGTGR